LDRRPTCRPRVLGRADPVVPVREAGGRLVDDWRAVRVVWKRELIWFIRTPVRIAASLAQPILLILFLFVLGTGLSSMAGAQNLGSVDDAQVNLPTWLSLLTKLNPMSYAVDPMRRAVFSALNVPSAVEAQMNPGMTWGDWRVPTLLELAIVAAFAAVMLLVAVRQFSKTE
jgi:hypothetical protein